MARPSIDVIRIYYLYRENTTQQNTLFICSLWRILAVTQIHVQILWDVGCHFTGQTHQTQNVRANTNQLECIHVYLNRW